MILDLDEQQIACGRWHQTRFPDAGVAEVGLKLAEETGEVCEAVNLLLGVNSKKDITPEEACEEILSELADVFIVGMALAERYTRGSISDYITKKMNVLTDPNGGHHGSVAMPECGQDGAYS